MINFVVFVGKKELMKDIGGEIVDKLGSFVYINIKNDGTYFELLDKGVMLGSIINRKKPIINIELRIANVDNLCDTNADYVLIDSSCDYYFAESYKYNTKHPEKILCGGSVRNLIMKVTDIVMYGDELGSRNELIITDRNYRSCIDLLTKKLKMTGGRD